ncbi:unnamed protein product [Trifolium pratense]|uniref:Uncharacterized protein n=1 Tax=Trifolium pratense TaxID=57577 RepID=A0ACB0I9K5_TRIPR|nr:unnamed protein product [Trifolium pratense]
MERIHVTVRARPLSPEDAKTTLWRISDNSIFIPNQTSKFEFDQIFNENCKTSEVYEARTKDIVAAAVRGFNGTVFAYGQTNSGKTHTMRGSKDEPGVIPRAVHDLFQILQQDVDREFLLRMSYMEIYNEEINDLLAPEHRKLQIHENIERGIYVAGLREEIVTSPEQVLDLMEFGESHRHIGETNMNLYSSRSHTIFRMIIESRDRNENESTDSSCDAVRVSVLNLVDLAGSERATKTGAEGVRLKEGSHINKSLMTLGTVIKKLSEGVESQGGHVPYRDSKLTRILQPALGGNANTAIICNITLAQIHTDETKSSLQFASRALRVTNCAKVNEIMTDAALLKRQKKEIEELRAKLTGSRSEHLETEILNLRNTLLQSELERERIALELEEEKKTQAEWEKRVHEQAKRIENLSSMVLFSNRDENNKYFKKEKRRDTWCPGNLSQAHLKDVYSSIDTDGSTADPIRPKLEIGPLLPFSELINEDDNVDGSCTKEDDNKVDAKDNCNLPNPCALLHVTNRRKDPSRKKSLSMQEDNKDLQLQAEYENFRESEAILVIKKLQEQINILEMEKLSSQQNLDTVFDLATEQNISAREKFEELNAELIKAQEAARLASEQLISSKTVSNINDGNVDFIKSVSVEIEDIMSEVQNSKEAAQSVILMVDDATKSFSTLYHMFFDFKASIAQDSVEQKSIVSNYQKLSSCLRQTISELENEKILLDNQLANIQKLLHQSELDAQSSHNSLLERLGQQELENGELLSYIQTLEKEISCLTSSSVAKEKETLRRDLEKAKTRSKETESKLKIAIQEKTKLEEEHKKLEVCAFESETRITSLEEEITAALKDKEEVISINEALNSELEDLTERLSTSTSEIYDLKEEISALKQRLEESDLNQEKFKSSIRVLVEEKEELAMQLTDALLEIEEERAIWSAREKDALLAIEEQARSNNEHVTSLSTELSEVRKEMESYREECRIFRERLTISYENMLGKGKFSENILDLDHLETFNVASKQQSQEISKPKLELQPFEQELHDCPEIVDGIQRESQIRDKGDHLPNPRELDTMSEIFIEFQNLKSKLSTVTEERDKLTTQLEDQQKHVMEVELLLKHCQDELSRAKDHIEELSHKISSIEVKIHADKVTNTNETSKLRMRLRGTQAKLDAYRLRYKEAIGESASSKIKYKEASEKLKNMLALKGLEVLNLKKQLAAAEEQ